MTPEEKAELWADVKPVVQLLTPFALLALLLWINMVFARPDLPDTDIYITPTINAEAP